MLKFLGLLAVLGSLVLATHSAAALTVEQNNSHSQGGGANFSDPDEQLPDMEAHVSEDPSGSRILPNDTAQAVPLFSGSDHKVTPWGYVYPTQKNH